jgi:outer membrane protein
MNKHFLISAFVLASFSVWAQNAMSLNDCINYGLTNHPNIKVAELAITEANWRIKENTATGLPQVSAGLGYTGFIQRGGLPSSALSFGPSGDAPPEFPPIVGEQFTGAQQEALGAYVGTLFQSDPDAKIFFSPVHTVAADLSANQLIFSNSYRLAKRAASMYRALVDEQLNVAKSTLRNQIIEAYLPALMIDDNLQTLDKNASNIEKLLAETRAVNKAGFVEQLDVDRLELALTTLRSERDNLARQREIVVDALKFAMGMSVAEKITLGDNTDRLMAQYADADLTSAMNYMNRPEYLNLLKGRELSQLNVQLNEKTWLPNVVGFLQWQGNTQGGFGTKGTSSFNDWYFIPSTVGGIKLTSTLYDSGVNKAKRQRAIIALQTVDEQKKLLENAFTLELEVARKQYMSAQERVASQQKSLDLAQKIYNTTQTKYKAGVGSSFEVVQAEQGVYSAQQNVMNARFDLLKARVAIRKALGQN